MGPPRNSEVPNHWDGFGGGGEEGWGHWGVSHHGSVDGHMSTFDNCNHPTSKFSSFIRGCIGVKLWGP